MTVSLTELECHLDTAVMYSDTPTVFSGLLPELLHFPNPDQRGNPDEAQITNPPRMSKQFHRWSGWKEDSFSEQTDSVLLARNGQANQPNHRNVRNYPVVDNRDRARNNWKTYIGLI